MVKKNMLITVLALDLEGTLINSVSDPAPRYGLYSFLEWCAERFPRIVIYTYVDEKRFRRIANKLVRNKSVPSWFKHVEHLECAGEFKDLALITEGILIEMALIVDDCREVIRPDQISQWIEIKPFDTHFPNDNELERVKCLFR